jgi:hypothetical protein
MWRYHQTPERVGPILARTTLAERNIAAAAPVTPGVAAAANGDDELSLDDDLMMLEEDTEISPLLLEPPQEQSEQQNAGEDQSEQGEPREEETRAEAATRASRKRKSTADLMLYEYSQAPPRGFRLPLSATHRQPTSSPLPSSSAVPSRPSNRPQPVQQIDPSTGEVIFTYPSRADAARSSAVSSNAIAFCCQGTRNSAGGFLWRYLPAAPAREGSEESRTGSEEGKGAEGEATEDFE